MEEAGVRGVLGRYLGLFENSERKHRTSVYILHVSEELEEWEDLKTMGRRRKWWPLGQALEVLSVHKPVQCDYLKSLMGTDQVT